jgi:hypothetical protein
MQKKKFFYRRYPSGAKPGHTPGGIQAVGEVGHPPGPGRGLATSAG